jgi:4,5-DOPA dioxygenase extradiol
MITRRALLGSAVAAAASTVARRALAAGDAPMPVAFVSHGGPMLAVDPVRGPALRAWGAKLRKPTGVLAITPHWGSRHIELGATGRGVAQYDFPRWLADKLPAHLAYASPPSEALAKRVEALLGDGYTVQRSARIGLDHTTWTPLMHLLPAADVPVLELAYPYLQEPQLFALGRRLAPLRHEGVLLLASGGMTHNLASVDLDRPDSPPPSWSREFDAWAAERLAASDADALLDWRHEAPAADLAHPDDGGHFRVMLVGLGAALAHGAGTPARFPYVGYELGLSVRCAELG